VSSRSNHEQNEREAYPWLEEKVYAKLRQRTIDLVRQSVDALLKDKQRVSLTTVVAKSKELDVEGNGRGISESAILDNQEARGYYEQHRSWRGYRKKRAKQYVTASSLPPRQVKPDRDEQRAHQRYLRMSKEALVERLLAVERTYADERERWLQQQDEVLTWRLRAEQAEARLKETDQNTRKFRNEG